MNRNTVIGFTLVAAAGALAYLVASSNGGVVSELFGKATWYAPYVMLVGGIQSLRRARG